MGRDQMRTFWKWSWIPASVLILSILLGLFVLWRPPQEEDDFFLVDQTFYLETDTADTDERLQNAYVNNSATNFFVKGRQLQGLIKQESQTGAPFLRSFYDYYCRRAKDMPEQTGGVSRWLQVTRQTQEFDGSAATDTTFTVGQRLPYLQLCRLDGQYYYRLDEQSYVAAADVTRLCQRTAFEGTLTHPYTVDINSVQYISFTGKGDYIYIYFSTDNEFISVFLDNLPQGSSWELYDGTYRKIGARYATGVGEEIYYRACSAGRFLLRVNAAAAADVTMGFHRDENEWQHGMVNSGINDSYQGIFDYYGDEDFYIPQQEENGDPGALVMELKGVDADLHIMAYDQEKNLIGRYTRKKGIHEEIVLYGLEDLYALSVRTVDGGVRAAAYTVQFRYQDVDLLGLETFGFKLSTPLQPGKDGENYYTAICNGLENKRISDVQTVGKSKVTMTLTTAAGKVYSFKEGSPMPLHVGKNTVQITIENPSDTRVITICITDINSYQLGYAFITTGGAPLRNEAVTSGGVITTLSAGTKVLSTGVTQNGFLKVESADGSGKTGWVDQNHLFDDYQPCAMPAAYAKDIKALQKRHPKWKFTFVRVGKTLNQAVQIEAGQKPIITTGDSWRTPSAQQIRYYMDPTNFLNEKDIFMFEKQTYHEGTYSAAGISAVWSEQPQAYASAEYYASCFLEAGRIAGLSPYFIAARASLESGNGTSNLARGLSAGYEGYYNFYGINAVDSNPKQGAAYAKERGWNTQRIAIIEGAAWIKDQYVSMLQYTPYFIKYSFIPDRGWHQYMTDIAAPRQDAARCYAAHKAGGTLNSAIEFVIPVFD